MLELIEHFLTSNDLAMRRVDETTWLMPADGDVGTWTTQITAVPEFDQVIVYADLDIDLAPERAGELAVWAALANRGLPMGNFEVDLDDCDVWFKTGIDVEGDELSEALLENVIASNFATVNTHLAGLRGFCDGSMTIEEAIDLAAGVIMLDDDELQAGIDEADALAAAATEQTQ